MTRPNQGLSSLFPGKVRKMKEPGNEVLVGWELDTGMALEFVLFNINPV